MNAKIHIPLELPALKLAKAIEDETYQSLFDERIMFLSQLEQERAEMVDHISPHQI